MVELRMIEVRMMNDDHYGGRLLMLYDVRAMVVVAVGHAMMIMNLKLAEQLMQHHDYSILTLVIFLQTV